MQSDPLPVPGQLIHRYPQGVPDVDGAQLPTVDLSPNRHHGYAQCGGYLLHGERWCDSSGCVCCDDGAPCRVRVAGLDSGEHIPEDRNRSVDLPTHGGSVGYVAMAICGVCSQEMLDGVSCGKPTWTVEGVERNRVRYDPDPDCPDYCADCKAPRGGLHHPGCDVERCPNPECRRQAISCGCLWDGDELTDSPTAEPRAVDYTRRRFGHDLSYRPIDGGRRLDVTGWGPDSGRRLHEGDYLILANGDRTTRYRVESVSYYSDPPDMWQADLAFAPREEPQPARLPATTG